MSRQVVVSRPSSAALGCRAQDAVLVLVFTIAIVVAVTRVATLLSA